METLHQAVTSSGSPMSPILIRRTPDSSAIPDETQLIDSILAGNTSLFHDLVRPYETLVYRMAFVMLRNEAEAEDAAQETFLRAYRTLAGYRSEFKFSTWLTSIVLNEARARSRRQTTGVAISSDSLSNQTTTLSAQYALEQDERALLRLERVERPHQLQRAIVDECSVLSTAQASLSTEGVIKTRLHRARRSLQRRLKANKTPEKAFHSSNDC